MQPSDFDFSRFYHPHLEPLFRKGFSVYDLEIKKGILFPGDRSNPYHPSFEYCKGFDDFSNMGISTAALYTSRDDRYSVYEDRTKNRFIAQLKAPLIIGYNSRKFDNVLLGAEWGYRPPEASTYDLLEEIWIGLGHGNQPFAKETHGGYGLDRMAKANLNYGKTDEGKFAPMMWQTGRQIEVADYNLGDVARTRALALLVQLQGYLISPKDGSKIKIRRPVEP